MVVSSTLSTYETETVNIAKTLLSQTRENRSWLSQVRDQMRWDDKLLDFAMSNPGLRSQLFRLIDCLPALHSKAEIARHLKDYLTDASVELPGALKGLINFSQNDSVAGQLAATTLSTAVETLAKRYIAGETVDQILKRLEQLRKQRFTFTIDLLGEAVVSETEAQAYLQRYLDLMAQLSAAAKQWPAMTGIEAGEDHAKPQVSVKLTAFYSQFNPLDAQGSSERVKAPIRLLLQQAETLGIAVHFDMEQYAYKALTLDILKSVLTEPAFNTRSDIGITLQAYLRDSYDDLKSVIEWAKTRGTPITVRLVKGAYWDQETIKAIQHHWPQPVYRDKVSTDANFERMTQVLLEHHEVLHAAIGSHNVRSQAHAIAIAEKLAIPKSHFELQVLYGMADKLAKALVDKGYRVRMYCPYGDLIPGMAYLIRRLLENTANSSFLRQNLENRPVEALVAQPHFTEVDRLATGNSQLIVTLPTAGATDLRHGFENVADSDYADTEVRKTAQSAFATVRAQLGQTYWPWVNGEALTTDTVIPSVNPSQPSEIVGQIGLLNAAQADQAVAAAKAAFPAWQKTPAAERAACLYRAADLMAEQRAQLSAWIVLEVGKPLAEADGEVSEAIDFCRYYANEMLRLASGYIADLPGETNRYGYAPRGLALVIAPWNFPLAIATGMTVAALVTGNCTLLKPAETASVIAAKLADILVQAGIPKGVFQLVFAKGSTVGAHLVNHPDIHLIAFTGSREVGCQIYAQAAQVQPGQKHLKRVIAEMGGKNALIIDESADLDQAVQGVVHSAFGYSGQKCSACSRVIVVAPVHDAFVSRLIEATRSLQVGIAEAPSTRVGPVIDATAQTRIQQMIAQGAQEGQIALAMESPSPGYFIGPTILTGITPDATVAQQEIFGPVLAVIRANNFEEALTIANGTDYALTGGLYSRTPAHITQAQQAFEVGNLYINRSITGAIVARQAFGGFKLSGVGSKAGGPDYLLQFTEPRVVTENIQRQGFAPIEGME
jgi:RHH-type transcriptional regulator, proline utilization regulon repressor / proline dehydrogenase / delta 1-pyrroline-5-carboxylate dehydrogenase